ncbi:MAG: serine hydrolase domain-containing protein [Blastocatellia bacterium]
MKQLISALILAVSLLPGAVAQTPTDFSSLEQVIQEEMKAQNVPGAQVAVISGDRVVWQKGLGVANAETNEAVTPETLFRLGSTTKTFVAAAAVALAKQGKLDLHKPIGEYATGLQPQIARLTMHQLLSHAAGLKDEAPMSGPLDESALAERVRGWNESMFFAEPGKIFSYSNPGYVLAGYVIEQVGGKPFAEMMNELVFQPLGLKRSTFRPTMAMTWPLAQGHNPARQGAQVIRPFAEYAGNWPPGSLFSNVTEFSRFLIALLNQGKLEGKQVLSPSLVQTIAAQKAVIPALDRHYGFGLISFKERGVQVVMNTGGRSGFGSIFYTAPEHRFAVVILANRTGAIFSRSARKAMEMVVPLAAPEPPTAPPALTMTAEEMANYVGSYINSESIRAELIVQDGKLFARLGGRQFAINKIGDHRFQAPGGAQLSEFVLLAGADGKPEFLAAEMWALRRIK